MNKVSKSFKPNLVEPQKNRVEMTFRRYLVHPSTLRQISYLNFYTLLTWSKNIDSATQISGKLFHASTLFFFLRKSVLLSNMNNSSWNLSLLIHLCTMNTQKQLFLLCFYFLYTTWLHMRKTYSLLQAK